MSIKKVHDKQPKNFEFNSKNLILAGSNDDKDLIPSPGGQDLCSTKIVIIWMVTDTKQLLNGCQAVETKLG